MAAGGGACFTEMYDFFLYGRSATTRVERTTRGEPTLHGGEGGSILWRLRSTMCPCRFIDRRAPVLIVLSPADPLELPLARLCGLQQAARPSAPAGSFSCPIAPPVMPTLHSSRCLVRDAPNHVYTPRLGSPPQHLLDLHPVDAHAPPKLAAPSSIALHAHVCSAQLPSRDAASDGRPGSGALDRSHPNAHATRQRNGLRGLSDACAFGA